MVTLKQGDVLIATHSRGMPDNVTAGREYRVTHVWQHEHGRSVFRIVNDEGIDVMPIESSFKLKEDI